MTLGIFLLLIFILYLIDKHNLWRRTGKITIWFVVISILGLGGIYSWKRHVDAKAKPSWDCEVRNAQFSTNAETECTKNPAVALTPDGAPVTTAQTPDLKWYKLQGQDGKWYKTQARSPEEAKAKLTLDFSTAQPVTGPWTKYADKQSVIAPNQSARHSTSRLVKALLDTDLKTTELGELTCGHIKAGEIATLLLEGGYGWIKVKTADGQIGWEHASNFEVVKSASN